MIPNMKSSCHESKTKYQNIVDTMYFVGPILFLHTDTNNQL